MWRRTPGQRRQVDGPTTSRSSGPPVPQLAGLLHPGRHPSPTTLAEVVLLAGPPSALLAIDQQHLAAQARKTGRVLGWFAAAGVAVSVVDGLAVLAVPPVVYETLRWTTAAVLGGCRLRVAVANRPLYALRAAGRTWATQVPGPVWPWRVVPDVRLPADSRWPGRTPALSMLSPACYQTPP